MAGLMSSALADMPARPANMTEAQYLEQLGQDLYSTKLVSTLGPIVMGCVTSLPRLTRNLTTSHHSTPAERKASG